jgi:hypothetical protein
MKVFLQIAVNVDSTDEGFPLSKNFASQWVLLLPENQPGARFRYIGSQLVDGKKCYVLGFAERPGQATVTAQFHFGGKWGALLYQGLVWVDAQSYRVVKLLLDRLEPRFDIGLERQTTEIKLGEVHIAQADSSLWLPTDVAVTVIFDGRRFRNLHHYSNYRLFVVRITIKYWSCVTKMRLLMPHAATGCRAGA